MVTNGMAIFDILIILFGKPVDLGSQIFLVGLKEPYAQEGGAAFCKLPGDLKKSK